jgi:hypothetical protein
MYERSVILMLLLGGLLSAGCSFVSLQPEAATVLEISAEEAAACERLGRTRVEVLSKVGFISRNQDTVAGELSTQARNSALDMGGNAVAAENEPENGKQSFGVYRCATD